MNAREITQKLNDVNYEHCIHLNKETFEEIMKKVIEDVEQSLEINKLINILTKEFSSKIDGLIYKYDEIQQEVISIIHDLFNIKIEEKAIPRNKHGNHKKQQQSFSWYSGKDPFKF